MPTRIQLRGGTTAQWEAANPTLAAREPGVEFPVSGGPKFKLGDGESAWDVLPYATGGDADALAAMIASAEPGEGAYAVGWNNPDGDLDDVATVGEAIDKLRVDTPRISTGTPPQVIESISDGDSVLLVSAEGLPVIIGGTAINGGNREVVEDSTYTFQSRDRQVIATVGCELVIPNQSDVPFTNTISIEIIVDTNDPVTLVMADASITVNGIANYSAEFGARYTRAVLSRGAGSNNWYLNGTFTADADTDPPEPLAFFPNDDLTGVSTSSDQYMDLNEACQFGSGTITLYENDGGWAVVEEFAIPADVGSAAGQVELVNGGTRLLFHRTADMSDGTPHSVQWSAGALEDVAGNPIAENLTHTLWNFTTAAAVITEPTPILAVSNVIAPGSGSATITPPSGIEEGDAVIFINSASTALGSNRKPPTPEYTIFNDISNDNDPSIYIAGLIAGASPPAAFTIPRMFDRYQTYAFIVLRHTEFGGGLSLAFTPSSLPNPAALTQLADLCGRLIVGACRNIDIDDIEPPAPYSRLTRKNSGQYNGIGTTLCVGWRTPQGNNGDSHDPGLFTGTGTPSASRAYHLSFGSPA